MLTMMCGLPGSGKSTLARQLEGRLISTDAIREFITGSESNLEADPLVFRIAREMIKFFLARGEAVIYDATNLTRKARAPIIKLARGLPVNLIWVDCPLEVALANNRKRARQVPEEVIRRLAKTFEPPEEEEGFRLIRIPIKVQGEGTAVTLEIPAD